MRFKNAHTKHAIKNYGCGELNKDMSGYTHKGNKFLKAKTSFSLKCVTAGPIKNSCHNGLFPGNT